MTMFHAGNRALKDRCGGCKVADKIVEMTAPLWEFPSIVELS